MRHHQRADCSLATAPAFPSPPQRRRANSPSPACSLQSCEAPAFPSGPRSGEGGAAQHRMRAVGLGCDRRGSQPSADSSAAIEEEARKRPSSAAAAAPSPVATGEGFSMCFHQSAALHACDSASLPFAPRSGEKAQACANSCLHCCDRLDRISEARLQPGPAQGSSTCGRRLRSKSTRTRWPPAAVASRRAARRSAWQTHRRTSPSASAPGSDPLARNR